MIFNNNTYDALMELERQRTGSYGLDDYDAYEHSECDRCSMEAEYTVDEHAYCPDCLLEAFRNAAEELLEDIPTHDEFAKAAKKLFVQVLEDVDAEDFCTDYFADFRGDAI